jgi:hypothetical protein
MDSFLNLYFVFKVINFKIHEIQGIISALQKWVFKGKSTPAISSHFGI